jgi:hypothetical protein
MLLDPYIRLRRIEEWPETIATALSVVLVEGAEGADGKSPDSKKIEFTYKDASGCVQNGKTRASADADLFFVDVGDTFRLRYNPRRPERYFVFGAYSPSAWLIAMLISFALVAAGLIKLVLMYSLKSK